MQRGGILQYNQILDSETTMFPPLLTGGGVDIDNLHERREPSVLGQNGSDGGVGGGEGVEEAEESSQFHLHGFHRYSTFLPPLTHHWVTVCQRQGAINTIRQKCTILLSTYFGWKTHISNFQVLFNNVPAFSITPMYLVLTKPSMTPNRWFEILERIWGWNLSTSAF